MAHLPSFIPKFQMTIVALKLGPDWNEQESELNVEDTAFAKVQNIMVN